MFLKGSNLSEVFNKGFTLQILGEENSKLSAENTELKNEMAKKSETEKSVAEISTISADKESEFEKTMIEYTEKGIVRNLKPSTIKIQGKTICLKIEAHTPYTSSRFAISHLF